MRVPKWAFQFEELQLGPTRDPANQRLKDAISRAVFHILEDDPLSLRQGYVKLRTDYYHAKGTRQDAELKTLQIYNKHI